MSANLAIWLPSPHPKSIMLLTWWRRIMSLSSCALQAPASPIRSAAWRQPARISPPPISVGITGYDDPTVLLDTSSQAHYRSISCRIWHTRGQIVPNAIASVWYTYPTRPPVFVALPHDAMRLTRTGLIQEDRPLGSFLFLGLAGVAKTIVQSAGWVFVWFGKTRRLPNCYWKAPQNRQRS